MHTAISELEKGRGGPNRPPRSKTENLGSFKVHFLQQALGRPFWKPPISNGRLTSRLVHLYQGYTDTGVLAHQEILSCATR